MRAYLILTALFLAFCAESDLPPEPTNGPPPEPTNGPPPAPHATLAIVGATVLPMTSNAVLEGQTVLVDGATIVAIGPESTTPVPKGIETIDGHGQYLVPGLFDMHVHLRTPSSAANALQVYLANGVTTIRNMAGQKFHVDLRAEVAAGAVVGPRIFTAGPAMGGVPPNAQSRGPLEKDTGPDDAEASVLAQKDAGYDFVKVYTFLSAGSYARIVSTAARVGLPVVGHVPLQVALTDAIAGHASIEHFFGYPAQEHQGTESLTVSSGVWNVPTLTVHEANANLAALQAAPPPEVQYVEPCLRENWAQANPSPGTAFEAAKARLVRLAGRGANLMLGTDSEGIYMVPGFALHRELELTAELLGSTYQALRLATVEPARFLGLSDSGTLAVGQRADAVLTDRNPLEDVANLRREHLTFVIAAGRPRDRTALDSALASIASAYATGCSPASAAELIEE